MKKVLVFGNPYVEEDSLAIKISKDLKINGFEFIICSSINDIMNLQEENLIILDVVENIKKTILIKDINQLQSPRSLSVHDFDLGFFLKLMHETNQLKEIKIIGIPQKGDEEAIKKEIQEIIGNL